MSKTQRGWSPFQEIEIQERSLETLSEGYCIAEKFRVRRPLGEGGMGSVYLADHIEPESGKVMRPVAVKCLKDPEDRSLRAQFAEESKTSLGITHPNVIVTHDLIRQEGRPYLIMEYVEGYDCDTMLQKMFNIYRDEDPGELRKKFMTLEQDLAFRPPDQAVAFIGLNIVKALQYAWETKGLIHRDVSPQNIMIKTDQGLPKLCDLGIATTQSKLIRDGEVSAGKPDYISPEGLYTPDDMDFRADIYSLGLTLYELLLGTSPNKSFDSDVVLSEHFAEIFFSRGEILAPSQVVRNVHPNLSMIIEKMTRTDRDKRYKSYDELRDDLGGLVLYSQGFGITTDRFSPLLQYWSDRRGFHKNPGVRDKVFIEHLDYLRKGDGLYYPEEFLVLTPEAHKRVEEGQNPCREIR